MKTEMTKSVGMDSFYEEGGGMPPPLSSPSSLHSPHFQHPLYSAITPAEAAESTISFITDKITPADAGKFWAPRGPM